MIEPKRLLRVILLDIFVINFIDKFLIHLAIKKPITSIMAAITIFGNIRTSSSAQKVSLSVIRSENELISICMMMISKKTSYKILNSTEKATAL